MLFNSYLYILLFLPLSLGIFYALKRYTQNGNIPLAYLVIASLFFYGWWEPKYLAVIISSILVNYGLGYWINRCSAQADSGVKAKKAVLILGIAANIVILGYFKYTTFIIENLNTFTSADFTLYKVVLPLAISFFTFQQIAFLVDTYRGECEDYNFIHYCLFVTFFPQLIAGPIVHHREMMPQFLSNRATDINENLYIGISFFIIGLIKKVIFADSIAVYATPVFHAADTGQHINSIEAWGGTLAYSLQLYFDFSGYADMAIGSARMFGIKLPLNFDSPYKARSIIDFWRCWHITLSRFLKDYLYIPLGGNRFGAFIRFRNLFITMLLGGLWHGAGWNFIIWGGLHGTYLVINHLFQQVKPKALALPGFLTNGLSWLLTFFAVTIAWVFFRAETFNGALHILTQMFDFSSGPFATDIWLEKTDGGLRRILGLMLIVLLIPNSQQLLGYCTSQKPFIGLIKLSTWRANPVYGALCVFLFIYALINMLTISPFLYFQF